jgi:hypothetical protein
MSARKICINHPSSYYTGKEQSPLHFGLSAEGYDINSIMEGYDKDLWIVEVRNSKKVWTKKEHINKMTYEIPLITETVGDLRECIASVAEIAVLPSVAPIIAKEPDVSPSVEPSIAEDNKKTKQKARKTVVSKTAAKPVASTTDAKPATNATNATDTTNATDAIAATKPATSTATDYTLFITYRIQQMKQECTDNKKNYDCARYEWKEYKNKPEELRLIMIAARQKATAK